MFRMLEPEKHILQAYLRVNSKLEGVRVISLVKLNLELIDDAI